MITGRERTMKKFAESFVHAFQGVKEAIKEERNLKIHFSMSILVIIFGLLFKIRVHEWLICLVFCALVISLELLNCAVERMADKITRQKDEDIRFIKDVSAGAVLFSAIMAAIAGLLIFVPYLLRFINYLLLHFAILKP